MAQYARHANDGLSGGFVGTGSACPLRQTPKGSTDRRRSMQISHSFLRTGEAKCSSCIEMRVEPHSKVVSRREYAHLPCRQDIYVMEKVGFGEKHIDRRLDRRAYARRSRRYHAVSNRFCRRHSVKSGTLTLSCVPPNPYGTGCSERKQPT